MYHLAVLATCRFGTSEIFCSSANSLISDDNARITGRVHIRPRLHLEQSSQHVILYALNGEAIFFQCHPYIWSTTVLHDTSYMYSPFHHGIALHIMYP